MSVYGTIFSCRELKGSLTILLRTKAFLSAQNMTPQRDDNLLQQTVQKSDLRVYALVDMRT